MGFYASFLLSTFHTYSVLNTLPVAGDTRMNKTWFRAKVAQSGGKGGHIHLITICGVGSTIEAQRVV